MRNRRREVDRSRAGKESGVALILVLLVMLVLTLLSAALVFTARSETIASTNYALDTQADYVAKAGIQYAVNWFRSAKYQAVSNAQAPTYYNVTVDGGPWSLYTSNAAPITCSSGCATVGSKVQLIGYGSGLSTNFPTAITNAGGTAITTEFATDLNNTHSGVSLTADAAHSGVFYVNAYLLNYQTVYCPTCTVNPTPMETWLITSLGVWTAGGTVTMTNGVITSGALAQAEEQAIIQPIYQPTFGDALYGYCSTTLSGSAGTCTDAYNSALGAYGGSVSGSCDTSTAAGNVGFGADIGANGIVSVSSNPQIFGNVLVASNSAASNAAMGCCGGSTGITCTYPNSTTGTNIQGSVITGAPYISKPGLPTFPGSGQSGLTFPSTAPNGANGNVWPQTSSGNTANPGGTFTPPNGTYGYPCVTGYSCKGSKANPYLINGISLGGNNDAMTLYGGPNVSNPVYYDINTLSEQGNHATLTVTGYVVFNILTSIDLKGQGILNAASMKPEQVQINLAGTTCAFHGNAEMAAILVAPAATCAIGGGGSSGALFGAIEANAITDSGGYPIHYDTQLSRLSGSMGSVQVSSYTRIKQ